MGAYLNITEVKAHLNVDADYTGDDQYIEDLILDVEEIVESEICVPINEIVTESGAFPRVLRRAMLLLIGSYYRSREDEIPNGDSSRMRMASDRLMSLLRNYAMRAGGLLPLSIQALTETETDEYKARLKTWTTMINTRADVLHRDGKAEMKNNEIFTKLHG